MHVAVDAVCEWIFNAFQMQGICRIECICILLGTCMHVAVDAVREWIFNAFKCKVSAE